MLIKHSRPSGFLELLGEQGGIHANAWLVPRVSHELRPFGTMGTRSASVEKVDGDVGCLVAEHLPLELHGLVKKAWVDPNEPGGRMAATE